MMANQEDKELSEKMGIIASGWRKIRAVGFTTLFLGFLLPTAVVIFHLYLVFAGLLPNLVVRPFHFALALPFVFLGATRGKKRWERISAPLFCAVGLVIAIGIIVQRDALVEQYGMLYDRGQMIFGILLLIVILEMARRQVKAALPTVAIVLFLYAWLGHHLPGEFGHPPLPLESIIGDLVITEGGVWGPLTGIHVSIITIFIILGSLVGAGKGGNGFMTLATKLAGRYRAGAAKVAVLVSAFFGSISGSATANVASTGAVTIPAMKRLKYPPSLAGAVEATASTGGQIMPPLMGSGAFVMMELLRKGYNEIMAASLLPALVFFIACLFGVDHFAVRYKLKGVDRSEIPTWMRVLSLVPYWGIPFGILLAFVLGTGKTISFAAASAVFAAILFLFDPRESQMFRRFFKRLFAGFYDAASQTATITSIILCAGIIIGLLNKTGMGVKLTSIIVNLSAGSLWPALILTGVACMLLGMEVPTTAAYVICISVAGPALQSLGMEPLTAHMFVYWYALLSCITPPVCGTVFVAAGIADCSWLKVAKDSMRLGLGLYIVPLTFVVNPEILHLDISPLKAILVGLKVSGGIWFVSAVLTRNVSGLLKSLIFLAIGLLLLFVSLPF